MYDFFRGWRRKVGGVSLILACGLMVGWIRSGIKFDAASININHQMLIVVSAGSRIHLVRITHEEAQPFFSSVSDDLEETGGFTVNPQGSRTFDPKLLADNVNWTWRWGDFEILDVTESDNSSRWLSIPYWICVFPLTALAALLIYGRASAKKLPSKDSSSATLSELRPDSAHTGLPLNRSLTCVTDVASGPLR